MEQIDSRGQRVQLPDKPAPNTQKDESFQLQLHLIN